MHVTKLRQENILLFLHVSYPTCKSLDVSTDFLVDRHTWSPHGKGRDRLPSYRHLARRQVGSEASRKQECVLQWIHTRYTMVRRTLPWCKKRCTEHTWTFIKTHLYTKGTQCSWMHTWAHIFPPAAVDQEGAKSPCNGPPFLHLTSNHHNRVPAIPTCLVHYISVWCILSPWYQPQISATLHSANYAILSAEAPPKLPFCYNQTLSQSESVPATPTCHRHSKPQDNLLGIRHMRSFIPKWDVHHEKKSNYFLQCISLLS